jgi:hypothetical protein
MAELFEEIVLRRKEEIERGKNTDEKLCVTS